MYLFEIQATSRDKWPTEICDNCIQNLITAHLFRLQCETAWHELSKMIYSKPAVRKSEQDVNSDACIGSLQDSVEMHETCEEKTEIENVVIKAEFICDEDINFTEVDDGNDKATLEPSNANAVITQNILVPFFINFNNFIQINHDNMTLEMLKSNGVFECFDCKKKISSLDTLREHNYIHLYKPPYICPDCQKHCNRASTLHRHLKQHEVPTGPEIRPYRRGAKKPRGKKLFPSLECPICSRVLSTIANLNNHIALHSRVTFDCKSCDAKFQSTKELNEHSKAEHTNEWRRLCSECGTSFRNNFDLRKHSSVHTGARPFKCEYCERCFSRRDILRDHERRHTGTFSV